MTPAHLDIGHKKSNMGVFLRPLNDNPHSLVDTNKLRDAFKKNKHKFVQKVAKKIILLISFKFSASISFVQTGSKRAK